MTGPSQNDEPSARRSNRVDPMMLPPRKGGRVSSEPEEGPRWLHFIAGLVVGFVLGAACSKFLRRRFGIETMNTIAVCSLTVGAAGAVLRGKLWRSLRL